MLPTFNPYPEGISAISPRSRSAPGETKRRTVFTARQSTARQSTFGGLTGGERFDLRLLSGGGTAFTMVALRLPPANGL